MVVVDHVRGTRPIRPGLFRVWHPYRWITYDTHKVVFMRVTRGRSASI